jgi:hypothetical protein
LCMIMHCHASPIYENQAYSAEGRDTSRIITHSVELSEIIILITPPNNHTDCHCSMYVSQFQPPSTSTTSASTSTPWPTCLTW